jgi:hypothetical protein
MLTTPTATDAKGGSPGHSGTLGDHARNGLLPTPTASDHKGSRNSTARRRPDSTGQIGDTLARLGRGKATAWQLRTL